MSYYDWPNLIKPFTVVPVIQDTIENTKALTLTPVNAIGTLTANISVPSVSFPQYKATPIGQNGKPVIPLIVGQVNYSLPYSFGLLNYKLINRNVLFDSGATVCIRYRVGNSVFRYVLFSDNGTTQLNPVFAPMYSGQVIKPNFVLEYWMCAYPLVNNRIVAGSYTLNTGIVYIPQSETDIGPNYGYSEITELGTLEDVLPENLPITPDPSGPWLTN